MHALIVDGEIVQVEPLPTLWFDGDRWWDFRPGQHDPTLQGWHRVVETERPADTDTHTHESRIDLVNGVPTRLWTPREWTGQETLARIEHRALLLDLTARVGHIEAHLWPPTPDPDPESPAADFPEFTGIWHAGQIIHEGGKLWRNITTVPLTAPPSALPGHEGHLYAEVTTVPETPDYPQWRGEWSPDAHYVAGDHVIRDGMVYRCLTPHGAAYQGTWGPPAAGVWLAVG